ncbi:MAG: hypothetical protein JWP25_1986 [Bradyrhizobium sp.]|jgi:hypothetical protein|nr:hypothetical protein [Bradyrhizobium sp.]
MSICDSAFADKSTKPNSPLPHYTATEASARETPHKPVRAIPDLPKDYPRPGRFGDRSLWDAVLHRRIPRSTFVDWENSGKIPPADKVIGRTKYWLEENVWSTMTSGKGVAA